MTFKEYIEKIGDDVFCIEEHCDGKFVGYHMMFGFAEEGDDDKDTVKVNPDLYYYQSDSWSEPTYIDATQEIEFHGDSVKVTDTNDNKVELNFFKATIIPCPISHSRPYDGAMGIFEDYSG